MPIPTGHCTNHPELVTMVKEIHVALLGQADPEGHEGLVSKVRRHDAALKAIKGLLWSALIAVVGCLITFVMR